MDRAKIVKVMLRCLQLGKQRPGQHALPADAAARVCKHPGMSSECSLGGQAALVHLFDR